MLKQFFSRNWPHLVVLALITIITLAYFSIQLDGYNLKQHDILQHKGMSHEIQDYREHNDEETLWTNSMFGGMPSMQVSLLYEGNYLGHLVTDFFKILPPPAGVVMLLMLGFYIFAMCMRINPWVGLFGAIVFGFATYNLVVLQAGHNSKALATAFLAPVLGAFLLTWKRNVLTGIILSGVFMTLELSMNHLQVTYYFILLLGILGVVLFVQTAFIKKDFKKALLAGGGLLGAYLIAALINYGNIKLTNDYAKYSIRGGNDVLITADGTTDKQKTTGLDKDYVTEYSNSIDESWTLVSPYVKGSAAGAMRNTPFLETVENSSLTAAEQNEILDGTASYWGDQPIVSGPAYIGIVVVFLAILAVVFFPSATNITFLAFAFFALMLSWGKNFAGLSEWMLDNFPAYNKFRAPTIIVVVIQLCCAYLAVRFLDKLWKNREELLTNKKKYIVAALSCLIILIGLRMTGLDDQFITAREQQQIDAYPAQVKGQILGMNPADLQSAYGLDVNNPEQLQAFVDQQSETIKKRFDNLSMIRQSIFNESVNRSIWFLVLSGIIVGLFFFTKIKAELLIAGITVVGMIDLMGVDREYLGEQPEGSGYRFWIEELAALYPISASEADLQILKMETMNPEIKKLVDAGEKEGVAKANELEASGIARTRIIDASKFAALNRNTNYRVFDFNGGFNSAEASYFHKSLGGYHGAKLRNIQNVFEYHLTKNNTKILNILNVKYMIKSQGNMRIAEPNMDALGNAWFVREVKGVKNADEAIRKIGNQFELNNVGNGKMILSGKEFKQGKVYSCENAQYILNNDTLDIPLANNLTSSYEVYFVMDLNGNTNLVPKMTLDADTSKSFLKLVSYKVSDEFTPNQEAFVLSDKIGSLAKTYSAEGTIRMKSYAPNTISYESNSKSKQFAVFSEVYFPEGWTATIDGKPVDILQTDYLLRGVEIPEGNHQIKFTFDLPAYHQASTYAMIGSLILLAGLAYLGWLAFKKRKTLHEV